MSQTAAAPPLATSRVEACPKCEAPITYVRMRKSGKRIPCNLGVRPAGPRLVTITLDGEYIYGAADVSGLEPHYATCRAPERTQRAEAPVPAGVQALVDEMRAALAPVARQDCKGCAGRGCTTVAKLIGRTKDGEPVYNRAIVPCGCTREAGIQIWRAAATRQQALQAAAADAGSSANAEALRGSSTVEQEPHTPQVVGSNPTPATGDNITEEGS